MMQMALIGLILLYLGTATKQLLQNHPLTSLTKMQQAHLSSNNYMSTTGCIMVIHFYLITKLLLQLTQVLFNMYTKFMAILEDCMLQNQQKMQQTILSIGSQVTLDFITLLNTLSMGRHMIQRCKCFQQIYTVENYCAHLDKLRLASSFKLTQRQSQIHFSLGKQILLRYLST